MQWVAQRATICQMHFDILISHKEKISCRKRQKVRSAMKKGLTELVFILDRSGSMSGLEEGYDRRIQWSSLETEKEEGEAYVSVVLFDDRTEFYMTESTFEKWSR